MINLERFKSVSSKRGCRNDSLAYISIHKDGKALLMLDKETIADRLITAIGDRVNVCLDYGSGDILLCSPTLISGSNKVTTGSHKAKAQISVNMVGDYYVATHGHHKHYSLSHEFVTMANGSTALLLTYTGKFRNANGPADA